MSGMGHISRMERAGHEIAPRPAAVSRRHCLVATAKATAAAMAATTAPSAIRAAEAEADTLRVAGAALHLRIDSDFSAAQRGLPQGLPQRGDAGLDHTPTWGRTYWGGALFCLLSDVEALRVGGPGRGLQAAWQGLLDAGGSYAVAWPVARIVATFDAAVGQSTFGGLYRSMKDASVMTDLPALWRSLGVVQTAGRTVVLDDSAPLSAVRRAITG